VKDRLTLDKDSQRFRLLVGEHGARGESADDVVAYEAVMGNKVSPRRMAVISSCQAKILPGLG